jgi:hypothetical protein
MRLPAEAGPAVHLRSRNQESVLGGTARGRDALASMRSGERLPEVMPW